MPKTQGDIIREATLTIERIKGDFAAQGAILNYERDRRHAVETDIVALKLEIVALRGELVTVGRELADWRRRSEIWSQRWWALGVGILLTLVAAAVTLLRKFT